MEGTLNPTSPADRGQWGGLHSQFCSSPEHTDQALTSGTYSQTTCLAEQSLQLWKGHVSLARHQGQGGAVTVESSRTAACSPDQPKQGGRWGMAVAGPSQVSPPSSAWQGPTCPVCSWGPGQGRSPQRSQGPCQHGALPGWVDVPAATNREAGWRAPKSYLQLGARTLAIPTGQGAGKSSRTPGPPARVCRWRPRCKPQPPRLCGPGHGWSDCVGGAEPRTPSGGMLTSGTAAAMLCAIPSTQ